MSTSHLELKLEEKQENGHWALCHARIYNYIHAIGEEGFGRSTSLLFLLPKLFHLSIFPRHYSRVCPWCWQQRNLETFTAIDTVNFCFEDIGQEILEAFPRAWMVLVLERMFMITSCAVPVLGFGSWESEALVCSLFDVCLWYAGSLKTQGLGGRLVVVVGLRYWRTFQNSYLCLFGFWVWITGVQLVRDT